MYVATILEVTKKESKSGGGPILEVKFEITDADKAKNKQFAGSHLWWYAMLPGHDSWDDTAWKLDQFLQALGVATKKKRKGSFDPDKHVGEELLINVRPGKNRDGDYKGEVGAVLQYDEDEWASGDDDDDDDEPEYDEDEVDASDDDDDDDGDEGDEEEDEDEEGEEEEDEEAGEYDDMTLSALRKEARERGLKPAGLDKGDLIEMLEVDDGEEDEEEEEEEEPAPKPRRKSPAKKPTTRKKTTAKKSTAKRGGTRARAKKSGFPFDE